MSSPSKPRQISVVLDQDLFRQVDVEAARRCRSKQKFIADIIRQAMRELPAFDPDQEPPTGNG